MKVTVGSWKSAGRSGKGPNNGPVSLSQGAKFGTVAVSRVVNMRGPRIDQRTQNFHFPVFHDSGNVDQCEERKISWSAKGANMATPRLAPPIKRLISLSGHWLSAIFGRIQRIRKLAEFH